MQNKVHQILCRYLERFWIEKIQEAGGGIFCPPPSGARVGLWEGPKPKDIFPPFPAFGWGHDRIAPPPQSCQCLYVISGQLPQCRHFQHLLEMLMRNDVFAIKLKQSVLIIRIIRKCAYATYGLVQPPIFFPLTLALCGLLPRLMFRRGPNFRVLGQQVIPEALKNRHWKQKSLGCYQGDQNVKRPNSCYKMGSNIPSYPKLG